MRNQLLLLAILFASTRVHADFLLHAGGFYTSATDKVNGGTTTTTRMPIDVHLAYLYEKNWAFGLTYDMENISVSSGAATTTSSRTGIGPTVGWTSRREMGFYGLLSYFVSASLKSNDTATAMKGTGLQAEGGYRILFKHFGLGVQGTYRSFTFKPATGGETVAQTRIEPGVFLIFEM